MRVSAIEAAKHIASSKFSVRDMRFEGFEDVGEASLVHSVSLRKNGITSEFEDEFKQLDIWAHMSMDFSGEPPESYRVLNGMVLDIVDDHEKEIKKEINPKLKDFLKERFPGIDTSDLDEDFDDYIWEDQVDYYPGIDPDDQRLHFMIELVLEIDDEDEAEDKGDE
jgi:hypothetical protein